MHGIFIILQIVVIIITGSLFGVNLYGTLMLRQYFDRIWFLPVESMSYKYSTMNTKVKLMSHFVKTRRPPLLARQDPHFSVPGKI